LISDMRKIVYVGVTLALLAAACFFFWPRSECGSDVGIGSFPQYRCSCAGFVGRDPYEPDVLDSTMDYRCFGFKIGETKFVGESLFSNCMENLCISAGFFDPVNKGDTYDLTVGLQNTGESEASYIFSIVKGAAYDANKNQMDNDIQVTYSQDVFTLRSKERKTIPVRVSIGTEGRTGAYAFTFILEDRTNNFRQEDRLYVKVK
jgi:hypothetical protein